MSLTAKKSELKKEIAELQEQYNAADTPQNIKDLLKGPLDNAKKQLQDLEDLEKKEDSSKPPAPAVVKKEEQQTAKVVTAAKDVVKKAIAAKKKKLHTKGGKKSLMALVRANKNLKKVYAGKSEKELKADASHKAKPAGSRISISGKEYREYRANRTDVSGTKPYLVLGGALQLKDDFTGNVIEHRGNGVHVSLYYKNGQKVSPSQLTPDEKKNIRKVDVSSNYSGESLQEGKNTYWVGENKGEWFAYENPKESAKVPANISVRSIKADNKELAIEKAKWIFIHYGFAKGGKIKKLATLTAEEDKAWEKSFTYYLDEGLSDSKADKLAWADIQNQFPHLKEFDGIAPDLPFAKGGGVGYKNTVYVEVFGGVANINACPKDVDCYVVDHDNIKQGDPYEYRGVSYDDGDKLVEKIKADYKKSAKKYVIITVTGGVAYDYSHSKGINVEIQDNDEEQDWAEERIEEGHAVTIQFASKNRQKVIDLLEKQLQVSYSDNSMFDESRNEITVSGLTDKEEELLTSKLEKTDFVADYQSQEMMAKGGNINDKEANLRAGVQEFYNSITDMRVDFMSDDEEDGDGDDDAVIDMARTELEEILEAKTISVPKVKAVLKDLKQADFSDEVSAETIKNLKDAIAQLERVLAGGKAIVHDRRSAYVKGEFSRGGDIGSKKDQIRLWMRRNFPVVKDIGWEDATDELPDLHKHMADLYNEQDPAKKYEFNFSKRHNNPAERNKVHRDGVEKLLKLMPNNQIEEVYDHYGWFKHYNKGGNTSLTKLVNGRYLELATQGNKLHIFLTDEGKEWVKENGPITEQNFYDLFEDIQANSELMYFDNLGNAGIGMTEAPGITDGYYHGDAGNLEENKDARLWYYNDYAITDFAEKLTNDGEVDFDAAGNYAAGGSVSKKEDMAEIKKLTNAFLHKSSFAKQFGAENITAPDEYMNEVISAGDFHYGRTYLPIYLNVKEEPEAWNTFEGRPERINIFLQTDVNKNGVGDGKKPDVVRTYSISFELTGRRKRARSGSILKKYYGYARTIDEVIEKFNSWYFEGIRYAFDAWGATIKKTSFAAGGRVNKDIYLKDEGDFVTAIFLSDAAKECAREYFPDITDESPKADIGLDKVQWLKDCAAEHNLTVDDTEIGNSSYHKGGQLHPGNIQKPSEEEKRQFFDTIQNELHYLYEKPVPDWDEYDLSNWRALVREAIRNGRAAKLLGAKFAKGGKLQVDPGYEAVPNFPLIIAEGGHITEQKYYVEVEKGGDWPNGYLDWDNKVVTDIKDAQEFHSFEDADDVATTFNIDYGKNGRVYARVRLGHSFAEGGQTSSHLGDDPIWHQVGLNRPPKNFTPAAAAEFKKAITELQKEKTDDAYYKNASAAMASLVTIVDELLGFKDNEQTPGKMKPAEEVHYLLQKVGIYNYKTGLLVNTDFLNKELANRKLAKGGNVDDEDDFDEIETIEPDYENDSFIDAGGRGGKYNVSFAGKFIGKADEMDEALEMIADAQAKSPNYFPTLWFVSDHGNVWPIDNEGNEIKYKSGGQVKSFADLKRKLQKGQGLKMVNYFGLTEPDTKKPGSSRLGITRYVVKVQSNGVYLNPDKNATTGSYWEFPPASLVEISDKGFKVYGIGERPLNEKEKEVIANQPKDDKQDWQDAMTDGSTMYYRRKNYFEKSGYGYLYSNEWQKGLHFNSSKNVVMDKSIRGPLELEYEFVDDVYSKGGRIKSALMRDRKYQSQEPWEQAYQRTGNPKHPKYAYAQGGIIKGTTVTINSEKLLQHFKATDTDSGKKLYLQLLKQANNTGKVVNETFGLVDIDFGKAGVLERVPKSILQPLSFSHGGIMPDAEFIESAQWPGLFTIGEDDGEKPLFTKEETGLLKKDFKIEYEYRAARMNKEAAKEHLQSVKSKHPEAVLTHSENEFGGNWRIWTKARYAQGGEIKNQYAGETAQQIWGEWGESQRLHFLWDHLKNFSKHTKKIAPDVFAAMAYEELPDDIIDQMVVHISEGQYAKGGEIKNQYAGKTAQQVWDEWGKNQREHFLKDHFGESEGSRAMSFYGDKNWDKLPERLTKKIEKHISEGQYAKGGIIKKSFFIDPSNKDVIKMANYQGLIATENHHLTAEGLIAKMREWDEVEHGVDEYIYDLTKKDLEKKGGKMPDDIRISKYAKGGTVSKANIEKLAKEFSRILRRDISAEDMNAVIAENKKRGNNGTCSTHDYLDANMSMDEAFTNVMGREYVFFDDEKSGTEKQNEKDTELVNAAWDMAKENDFYPSKKLAEGGRTSRGRSRDRKFKSRGPHEQEYKRKTSPKNPIYKKIMKKLAKRKK